MNKINSQYIPNVTVLLSTYNGEKYLKEQLDSILNQKDVNVFLLVRDDGSTDKTKDILKEYKNKGRLEWYAGQNLNVCKSYLNLISQAPKAEYYAFSDQDDVWDEDKLITAVEKLRKINPNKPSLYYSSLRLVDENLNFIANHIVNSKRSNITSYVISNVAGCSCVFNRILLEKLQQYNPEFILMHDGWAYKVCVALGGEVVIDEIPHISYRQHGNNVVGLQKGLKSELKKIKKYIYDFKIKKQMENLYEGYSHEMIPKYRELTEKICKYDTSFKSKMELINNKDINFKNKGLNITFKLKVILGKM